MNLAEPGWKLKEGQVLWRSSREAPEIAGEILIASHPDGQAWLQFIKTPLPLITAQRTEQKWQIEYIPEKRRLAGSGPAPTRFIWLHLFRALDGKAPPLPLEFQKGTNSEWTLENKATGEVLRGYLVP